MTVSYLSDIYMGQMGVDFIKLKRKNKILRKQLKDEKMAKPKPVEKARVAVAILSGLNDESWSQVNCSGVSKDIWLRRLFEYLEKQGVSLK